MTPKQLKVLHKGHFFDKKWMESFGDTMENFVTREIIHDGRPIIELYRKNPTMPTALELKVPVMGKVSYKYEGEGLQRSAYFDPETGEQLLIDVVQNNENQ